MGEVINLLMVEDSANWVRRGDTFWERETERQHKDGTIIQVLVTVSPIKNSAGEIIGAASVARDTTRQRQAEAERNQLLQNLTVTSKQVQTLTSLLPVCTNCQRIAMMTGIGSRWKPTSQNILKLHFRMASAPVVRKNMNVSLNSKTTGSNSCATIFASSNHPSRWRTLPAEALAFVRESSAIRMGFAGRHS